MCATDHIKPVLHRLKWLLWLFLLDMYAEDGRWKMMRDGG